MKKAFQFVIGVCLLLVIAAAQAADWDVNKVTKQSSPLPNAAGTTEEAGKFLHVTVDVNGTAPSWSKFKVVNEQGELIASPAGYNPNQNLVVFEGDWTNMIGRYLENGDQRIPLFQKEAPVDAAPEAVVAKEVPVQQPVVQQPVQVVERTPEIHRPVEVVERAPVVVRDRDDVVIHDRGHVVDRTHVVHDGVGVVHHGDGVVVHDGVGVVHHDGVGVVHDGVGVVHHDGDGVVHHYHHGDGVVHDGVVDGAVAGVGGHGGAGHGGDGIVEVTPWDIDPLGRTLGMAGTVAMGDVAGVGGFGSGYGVGLGYGSGEGCPCGEGAGPGDGPGTGPGDGPGPGDGSGEACPCGEDGTEADGPEEGPEEKEPKNAPGDAPGPGNGPGMGNGYNNLVNLAPHYRQRVRNLAPKMKLPEVPTIYGPDVLVYNPQIPYWNPQLPYYNPSYGYGGGGGGGYGNGYGGGGDYPPNLAGVNLGPMEIPPGMVLYISCGDEGSEGKVYQVDENGRVLGVTKLPQTATGIALHRTHGLVCVSPREGGKVYRINDGGIVEPIIEKDDNMAHPVDVAMMPNSDSFALVDDLTDSITLSNVQGKKLDTYKKIDGMETTADKKMSVAAGRDKAIIFSSNGQKGVFRFSGNAALASSTPVLPEAGGVAADPYSDRWAATQGNNKVMLMQGNDEVTSYELPPNKFFYGNGLMSFSTPATKNQEEMAANSGVVVAMRDADNTDSAPYLMEFKTDEEGKVKQRLMFQWDKEKMQDFVVGPRMLWEENHRDTYKGLY